MPHSELPPSPRMKDLAREVERITTRQGYPPSFRQLGEALGVGLPRARDLAHAARDRGLVQFTDGTPRSIHAVRRKDRGA